MWSQHAVKGTGSALVYKPSWNMVVMYSLLYLLTARVVPVFDAVQTMTPAASPTSPPSVVTSVSITPGSGTNTAGEIYSLECSVTVTGSTDQPLTITWLDRPVSSVMVTTTGSMSTLKFTPLSASHAGTYTCRATVGSTMQTETIDVTVDSEGSVSRVVHSFLTSIISRPSHLCQC